MPYKTIFCIALYGFFKNRRRKGNFFKIRRKKVFILFYLKLEKENPNNFLKRKGKIINFLEKLENENPNNFFKNRRRMEEEELS